MPSCLLIDVYSGDLIICMAWFCTSVPSTDSRRLKCARHDSYGASQAPCRLQTVTCFMRCAYSLAHAGYVHLCDYSDRVAPRQKLFQVAADESNTCFHVHGAETLIMDSDRHTCRFLASKMYIMCHFRGKPTYAGLKPDDLGRFFLHTTAVGFNGEEYRDKKLC